MPFQEKLQCLCTPVQQQHCGDSQHVVRGHRLFLATTGVWRCWGPGAGKGSGRTAGVFLGVELQSEAFEKAGVVVKRLSEQSTLCVLPC